MLRAEQTARAAVRIRCGDSYEPVVLPGTVVGKDGWLVYLLASTAERGAEVLEGHHLIRVSADGSRVIEEVRLSRSCDIGPPPRAPRADGFGGVFSLWRTLGHDPTEADYFTAMRYRAVVVVIFPGARQVEIHGNALDRGRPLENPPVLTRGK